MKGERIGHYEVLGKIGEGGMGTVYLARHVESNRRVALKTISERWLQTRVILKRFIQEAEVLARIDHPNIVTTYAFFEDRKRWYIALEYVHGPSLSSLIRRDHPLQIHVAADLAYKIARGLACAHQHGVIHRDIKPSNVLLKSKATPKITDFGLVRYVKNEEKYPRTGATLLGSPKYMSPEHWTGEKFTFRSDIYSLGILLHQLLVGALPFHSNDLDELRDEMLSTERLRPAASRSDISPELDEIVQRMTRKHPKDRFASMTDVMAALAPHRRAPRKVD